MLAEAAAIAAAADALPPVSSRDDVSDVDASGLAAVQASISRPSPAPTILTAAVAVEKRPTNPRLVWYLRLAVLIVLISAAAAAVGAYAKSMVDQRDTALAVAQAQINDLSHANLAFQAQVTELTGARDQANSDLATRTTERDSARAERDSAQADAASVRQDLDSARKQATDLQSSLADSKTQLDQARQDSSNQQQRANNSDARSTAIAAVLQLDDQIYSDFYNFLNEVNTMDQAVRRNDYFSASSAYSRSQIVAGRLDNLFNQRKAALAKI